MSLLRIEHNRASISQMQDVMEKTFKSLIYIPLIILFLVNQGRNKEGEIVNTRWGIQVKKISSNCTGTHLFVLIMLEALATLTQNDSTLYYITRILQYLVTLYMLFSTMDYVQNFRDTQSGIGQAIMILLGLMYAAAPFVLVWLDHQKFKGEGFVQQNDIMKLTKKITNQVVSNDQEDNQSSSDVDSEEISLKVPPIMQRQIQQDVQSEVEKKLPSADSEEKDQIAADAQKQIMREIVKKSDVGHMVVPTKMASAMKINRVSSCRQRNSQNKLCYDGDQLQLDNLVSMGDKTYDTDDQHSIKQYLKNYRYTANVADKFGFNNLLHRKGCNDRQEYLAAGIELGKKKKKV